METEEVSTLRVSTRAIPYGHQSPAGLRNGLWPVHIILLVRNWRCATTVRVMLAASVRHLR